MFAFEKALDSYSKSSEIRVRLNNEKITLDPILIECYLKSGTTSLRLKDPQKSLDYFNRIVSLYKTVFGGLTDELELARTLNWMGVAYQQLGDTKQAFDAKMKSYEMRKRILVKFADHADLAESLDSLGTANEEQGDLKRALELKTAALSMRNRLYENVTHHTEIADSLISIARTNERMGHYRVATDNYIKALLIKKQLSSDDDPAIFELHNLLAQVNLKDQKDYHKENHNSNTTTNKEQNEEQTNNGQHFKASRESKLRRGLVDWKLKGFFNKKSS